MDRYADIRAVTRRSRGFTLIELMVVLVVLGLLAGLVGPRVMKHLAESKSRAARLQVEDLGAALELYFLDLGVYPSMEEGLHALVQAPAGAEHWNGPYLRKRHVPKDPWGQEYGYSMPGAETPFELYSLGADRREGGEGEDRDIHLWE